MSKITSKGHFLGTIGPIYFRSYKGKPIAQTKPVKGRVKQTAATKLSASEFGYSSRMSKIIRRELFPILQDLADTGMYRRFTSKVYEAVIGNGSVPKGNRTFADADLERLKGFEFNTSSPFRDFCKLVPEITTENPGAITISIPEFVPAESFARPTRASNCELCYLTLALDPEDPTNNSLSLHAIPVVLNTEPVGQQQLVIDLANPNRLIIIVAAVFYFQKNRVAGNIPLNNKTMHPCRIEGVFRVGAE